MVTIYELIAVVGLITIAIVAFKLNKRYDFNKDEMEPIVKRRYK